MKNKKLTAARMIMTVLTVAAIAAIFYNSMLNADDSTDQSTPVTELLNGFLRSFGFTFSLSEGVVRKLAHFTEYSVLGVLLTTTVYLYTQKRTMTFCISLPSGVLIAVCDELIQLGSEGRSCQPLDVLIDGSGILLGALIVIAVISVIEKRKVKSIPNK